jgi:hypothetical protein
MRGKVTADAYSGGEAIRGGVIRGGGELVGGELVGGGSGVETRVGGFAMRVDDWEVTRHHLPASLQPIRAEQIGFLWFLSF